MSQIITAEDIKGLKPEATDLLAGLVADAVNAMIENTTSRCWGESKTVTELQNASGVVWLNHMDVTAVESVKAGYPSTERETLDEPYKWTKQGRLILHYGSERALPPSTLDYLEIEYTYGVPEDEVPGDLKLAAIGLALDQYDNIVNSGKDVSSAQVGSYKLTFGGGSGASGSGSTTVNRHWQVINSYQLRRV